MSKTKGNLWILRPVHAFRMEADLFSKLEFCKENDTLFLLEDFPIQGGGNQTLWNLKDTVSASNATGNLVISNKPTFTPYLMGLVSQWNIEKIKEEQGKSIWLSHDLITATKIEIRSGTFSLERISFKDFYDPVRDNLLLDTIWLPQKNRN